MYKGRFAPSPSGPLHMGSLVCALASYLDAKANNGSWFVRIEDLDTPRCNPKYIQIIQQTLACHGLHCDGPVLVQSERLQHYQDTVHNLLSTSSAYFCLCTRKAIRANKGVHSPNCKLKHHTEGAVRYINNSPVFLFRDRFKGSVRITDQHALEDFTLLRKDGIFAYNLAVVVDDLAQNITHIVRGDDLLTTTGAHLSLYKQFNTPPPVYAHIPVVKQPNGLKLSKQNHAPPVDNLIPLTNLRTACYYLGINIDTNISSLPNNPKHILEYAISAWRVKHALCD